LDPIVNNLLISPGDKICGLNLLHLSLQYQILKQIVMAIKQTDIRLMEINGKMSRLNDRAREILGEKLSLMFKMEHDDIHPILFMLKVQALDFEAMLIAEQVEELVAEHKTANLIADMGLDYQEEKF
jgi:hypothetical protein